jgi:outer membrane protein
MFKKLALTAMLTGSALSAQSDSIGFEVGAELWRTSISGYIDATFSNPRQDPFNLTIDLEDNLNMEKNTSGRFYFDFYHPLPYLPNLSASVNRIEHSGEGNPLINDIFDGIKVDGINLNIEGFINLNHYDITGFWSPIDNPLIALDLGVTLRQFDGKIDFIGSNEYTRIPVSGKIDNLYILAYGKITAHLPLTGLAAHLAVDGGYNFNADSPEQAFDLDLGMTYRTFLGLGVGLGYRYFDADLEGKAETNGQKQEVKYKLTTQGPYISLSYRL